MRQILLMLSSAVIMITIIAAIEGKQMKKVTLVVVNMVRVYAAEMKKAELIVVLKRMVNHVA